MTLAATFPILDALAAENGPSLDALAAEPMREDGLNLHTCCTWVRNGMPSSTAPDPFAYLSTLERALVVLDATRLPRLSFWHKVKNKGGTQFLDTIAEAALGIWFVRQALTFEVDKKFTADAGSKDADFFIGTGAKGIWIDVVSMREQSEPTDISGGFMSVSTADLSALLEDRVSAKFAKKFRDAIEARQLPALDVGVFLCVFKAQVNWLPAILLGQLTGENVSITVPSTIWARNDGLGVVSAFDLVKGADGVLQPAVLARAVNPALGGAAQVQP